MGIPRERRIRTRREIGRLLAGRRERGPALELFHAPAAGPDSRASCITPKFGHNSVERNRLRRRLKELIREILLDRGDGRDWLVRSRPTAYDRSYRELRDEILDLVDRLDEPSPGTASEAS